MRSFVPCRSPARHSLSRSLRSPESPTSRSSSLLIKPYTQQQPRQQQCEIRRLASRKPAYQPLYFEIRRLARTMSTQPTAGAVAGHGGRAIGDTDELKLVNRLGESRSPYVRGHMSNPVAWQMWSPEALALAKKHNRLIFVSIGYAACHWCHVMERESFESNEVAAVLNSSFIPIKIDREERPDVDRIYMNYVQATTGGGGWPLNVFLTPDLEPLFGGTYWPGPGSTTTQDGQIGFLGILKKMSDVWSTQRQRCLDSAKDITAQLRQFAQEGMISRNGVGKEEEGDVLDLELLEEAYGHFAAKYDQGPGQAGFGTQPKFPTPINLQFLLSLGQYPKAVADVVGEAEVETAKDMAVNTLLAMFKGGIHDHIGHGFARYSVTRDWSLPHFEKMLYDQAQLLDAYLDAYLITKDDKNGESSAFLSAVLDIGTYLTTPPAQAPSGGFFSAEDADSLYRSTDAEKREGAFYVWTLKELQTILCDHYAGVCAEYWNVTENGNVSPEYDPHDEFINQNVLAVSSTPAKLASKFGLREEDVVKTLQTSREKLREHREKERPRPLLDDKIVVSWNGLAVGALARASVVLKSSHPKQSKIFLDAAENAVAFIRKELFDESSSTLKRVYREGPGDAPGFADDYAFLIGGVIDLYEATFNDEYLELADKLQKTQISLFWDENAYGFFSTTASQPDLILRLKDGMDNAEPSTNGVSARNLNRLASIFGDENYTNLANRTTTAFEAEIMQHPFLFVGMLESIVAARLGIKGIVVTGDGAAVDNELQKLRAQTPYGKTLVRLGGGANDSWLRQRSELLRAMNPAKAGVQVCEDGICREVLQVGNAV